MYFLQKSYFTAILCLIFVDVSLCKCGKELKAFSQCFRDAHKAIWSKTYTTVSFDDFEKKVSNCFTSNGCKAVKLETAKEIRNRTSVTIVDDVEEAVTEKKPLKDCRTKIRQSIRDNIEKCLQSKIDKDFNLPTGEEHDYMVDRLITRNGYAMEVWAKSLYNMVYSESICPAKLKSDKKVITCVEGAFDEISDAKNHCKNPFAIVATFDERQKELCAADCFSKLKGDCLKLNQTFPIGCTCSNDENHKNADKYKKDFMKCAGDVGNSTAKGVIDNLMREMDRFVCQPVPENPCEKIIKPTKLF